MEKETKIMSDLNLTEFDVTTFKEINKILNQIDALAKQKSKIIKNYLKIEKLSSRQKMADEYLAAERAGLFHIGEK